jgi:mannose-6-phosphate isomerase-like protein (cupin superfamily)
MFLKPGEDIGEEVHKDRDQFFRIEKGKGEVLIDGKRSKIKGHDAVLELGKTRYVLSF